MGQIPWVGTVAIIQMYEVHIGHLTAIMHRAPSSSDGREIGGNDPHFACRLKWFLEEGREHFVFLTIGLDRPFTR